MSLISHAMALTVAIISFGVALLSLLTRVSLDWIIETIQNMGVDARELQKIKERWGFIFWVSLANGLVWTYLSGEALI